MSFGLPDYRWKGWSLRNPTEYNFGKWALKVDSFKFNGFSDWKIGVTIRF